MDPSICIRVCLAVVDEGRILLVPHFDTDVGPVQWVIPGGRIGFGESLEQAAAREFYEETGLHAKITGLLNVSEVILPEKPYHSITIAYNGTIAGGELRPEPNHPHGEKKPRWLSAADIASLQVHPSRTVREALNKATGMV